MTLESQTLRDWLQLLSVVLIPLGSVIYTWIATRDKDNSQHIKAVEQALGAQIASHASRIDRIEAEMKHLPAATDVVALMGEVKAMQAAQEATQREIHGVRLTTNRIEDYLLK